MSNPGSQASDGRRDHDYVGHFNFHVELENVVCARFKAVTGLQVECEPIEYVHSTEGIIRKRPGRIKVGNITLKRGFAQAGVNPLWEWWDSVAAGKVVRKSGTIVLFNDHSEEVMRYDFTEAWPVKWKGWDLEGVGNELAIEELEICVETLTRRMTGSGHGDFNGSGGGGDAFAA